MAFKFKRVKKTSYITLNKTIKKEDHEKIREIIQNVKEACEDGGGLFIFDYSKTEEIDQSCVDVLNEAQNMVREDENSRILVIEPKYKREVKEFMMDNRIGRTGEFCQATVDDIPKFIKRL